MRRRIQMRLELEREFYLERRFNATPLSIDDAESLGALMLDAYRDTVDDEGETLEDAIIEARETILGRYGDIIRDSTLVVRKGQKLLGACVITNFNDAPLLAFSVTHPSVQRRGIAEFLIRLASNRLYRSGFRELFLFVTIKNAPAVNMYRKIGFKPVLRKPCSWSEREK